jgi:transcription elongation factor GreA
MSNVLMTKSGHEDLLKEKEEILSVKIPRANEALQKAREQGDLSENSAYTAAKEEREMLSTRLDEINDLLISTLVIKPVAGTVGIGSVVIVNNGKVDIKYTIVGEFESNPLEKKISHKSPLGLLLVNKKVGDKVELKTENGTTSYKILSIE